jgi:hypothetical protein
MNGGSPSVVKNFMQAPHRIPAYLWLVVCGLLAHLPVLLLAAADPSRALPPGDPPGYLFLAKNILANGVFSTYLTPPFLPEIFRTPGYPYFLAGLLALGGQSLVWVVAAQLLLRVIGGVFLARVAGELLGSKPLGMLAGCLWMVSPLPALYAGVIAPETVFAFLILGALLLIRRGTLRALACAGCILGVAVLVRPIGILLLFILVPAVLYYSAPARKLICVLAYLCAAGIAMAPWLIRNELAFGQPVLSSISGGNLLEYNAASCLGRRSGGSWESGLEQARQRYRQYLADNHLRIVSSVQESDVMTRVALGIYLESPLVCGAVSLLDGLNSLRPGASYAMLFFRPDFLDQSAASGAYSPAVNNLQDPLVTIVTALFSVWYFGLYFAVALGIGWMCIRRRWDILWLWVLPMGVLLLAPGMAGNARFRIPVEPGMCLLAVAGVAWVSARWKKSRKVESEAGADKSGYILPL